MGVLVLRWVSFVGISCRLLFFFNPVCHSVSFDRAFIHWHLIDRYVFIAILNFVFLLILFLFLFFVFPFVHYAYVLLFGFGESVVGFWFVVALFFKYVNPFFICLLQTGTYVDSNIIYIFKNPCFLTLLSHILWFWCPRLHLHGHPFAVYCKLSWWESFNILKICVMSYLSDLFPLWFSPPLDSYTFHLELTFQYF